MCGSQLDGVTYVASVKLIPHVIPTVTVQAGLCTMLYLYLRHRVCDLGWEARGALLI